MGPSSIVAKLVDSFLKETHSWRLWILKTHSRRKPARVLILSILLENVNYKPIVLLYELNCLYSHLDKFFEFFKVSACFILLCVLRLSLGVLSLLCCYCGRQGLTMVRGFATIQIFNINNSNHKLERRTIAIHLLFLSIFPKWECLLPIDISLPLGKSPCSTCNFLFSCSSLH